MTPVNNPDDEFIEKVAAAINALDIDVSVHEGTGSVRADYAGYLRRKAWREAAEKAARERIRLFDEWHASPDGTPWPFP